MDVFGVNMDFVVSDDVLTSEVGLNMNLIVVSCVLQNWLRLLVTDNDGFTLSLSYLVWELRNGLLDGNLLFLGNLSEDLFDDLNWDSLFDHILDNLRNLLDDSLGDDFFNWDLDNLLDLDLVDLLNRDLNNLLNDLLNSVGSVNILDDLNRPLDDLFDDLLDWLVNIDDLLVWDLLDSLERNLLLNIDGNFLDRDLNGNSLLFLVDFALEVNLGCWVVDDINNS